MGLDNGIVVRTKEQSEVFGWIQKTVFGASAEPTLVNDESGYKYEYDITYWRKCYGIRSFIFSVYRRNHPDDKTDGRYSYNLTTDDIKDIQWFLHHCVMSEQYYDDQTNSIWEYKDLRPILEQQVRSLEVLIQEIAKQGNNIKVIFYDSY